MSLTRRTEVDIQKAVEVNGFPTSVEEGKKEEKDSPFEFKASLKIKIHTQKKREEKNRQNKITNV